MSNNNDAFGGLDMKTEFDKIAGYKEEKKELLDICYLVNNRLDLQKAGGKLPKGLCLIGPNGVGKTALAKAFCSEAKCNIVSVNYNDVNCDDDFTDYIKDCFEEAVSKIPCILFIDELHTIIGAGGPEGTLDASNMLKPALSRGELQLIGVTTTKEYSRYIERDSALERRFQKIKICLGIY